MNVHNLGHFITASTGSALKTGDGEGKTPFTEQRQVALMISTSEDYAGTVEVEHSNDGGTTWVSTLMTADEKTQAAKKGMVFAKQIVLPNQIRAKTGRSAGSISFYLLSGGA